MNKTILAITAHADDHVTFAGTVMKLQQQGYDYYELMLTNSDEGTDVNKMVKETNTAETADIRYKEFQHASKLLNITKSFYFNEEDQNLNYSKDIMHKVAAIIREVKPSIGLTMNTIDVHPDHIATAQIAKEAFRWAAKNFHPEWGKPHRTNIVLFGEGTLPITPSFLVDITPYYIKKEQLFRSYTSQASSIELELFKGMCAMRGYHLRKPTGHYAEAFSTEQNILPILFENI